jgi:replicative DNA helicase
MFRDVINIASSTLTEAYNPQSNISDLIDKYEKNLTEITTNLTGNNLISSRDIYVNMIERNRLILENGGKLGVTSGFKEIDKITSGWQEPDLIILAARPGMGKSSLAAQLVTNPSITQGKSVALFTMEMSTSQFYARMQSQQSGIPVEKILRTGLNEYEMNQLTNNCYSLINAPIFIDDTAGISIFDLKNKCRKLKREKNLGLIVVDYLQLITVPDHKGNREQEIGIISRTLKNIAKELNVPVIALSQLSRAVEARQDKRPMLSDLRESGSIEMDADIVSFLYRPEYYGIMQDEKGNSTSGVAMFIIAKHRNGPLADIMLNFEHEKTKFTDYQPYTNYFR